MIANSVNSTIWLAPGIRFNAFTAGFALSVYTGDTVGFGFSLFALG